MEEQVTPELAVPDAAIECPLCLGEGRLKRSEVLDRLGVKDFARVAQLSAEEAFRLLQHKHDHDEQSAWARFDNELAKRTAVAEQRHANELHSLNARIRELEAAAKLSSQQNAAEVQRVRAELENKLRSEQSENRDLNRRLEDRLREAAQLEEQNHQLQAELAKVARIGRREELDFAEEAVGWPGIWVSEKLPKHGDYLLAFRDAAGNAAEPKMVIDNKNKDSAIAESDIKKLICDAKERRSPVGVIVAKDESQLRQADRECRWAQEDGVWILRTARGWLRRDLDVLRPLLERMRADGTDFLQANAALAEEVRRTFVDLDEVDKELKKAAKAIDAAAAMTGKYKTRLQGLCDSAAAQKMTLKLQQGTMGMPDAAAV
jgi:hypothetical protein